MKDTAQKSSARRSGLQMVMTNYRSEIGVFIALILYCAVISVLSPYFLTKQNMLNLFSQLAVVGVLAIGEIFVLLTGGIDLSVGNTMGLSCMAGGMVMASTQSMAAGIAVALLMGLGCCHGPFHASKLPSRPARPRVLGQTHYKRKAGHGQGPAPPSFWFT